MSNFCVVVTNINDKVIACECIPTRPITFESGSESFIHIWIQTSERREELTEAVYKAFDTSKPDLIIPLDVRTDNGEMALAILKENRNELPFVLSYCSCGTLYYCTLDFSYQEKRVLTCKTQQALLSSPISHLSLNSSGSLVLASLQPHHSRDPEIIVWSNKLQQLRVLDTSDYADTGIPSSGVLQQEFCGSDQQYAIVCFISGCCMVRICF